MFDVIALGELLIDFTPVGVNDQGNNLFCQNPGGAPANVLVALSKLGKRTAFLGKVGNDQFGHFLGDILKQQNIDTSGLVYTNDYHTTLAFVHLDKTGDRSFTFYRKPSADMMLQESELELERLAHAKFFHFGSVTLTDEPSRTATLAAASRARELGVLVSFDPNFREPLWKDHGKAREMIWQGIRLSHIIKLSEEEFALLTGTDDLVEGTKMLEDHADKRLILVTLGEKGAFYRFGQTTGLVPGYKVNAVDTTGAGDAFVGGILYHLLEREGLDELTASEIESMLRFTNAAGAFVTTKNGAIPAMPTIHDIQSIMETNCVI
ncbi:PfkB family carbohydrate kinase [Brevibacillus formosus]|uniref:PfkB family carbohydrate kinase n=1 Tax=Brevibacillus formosus TaxID=54913 RepID=UPI003F197699